MERLFLYLEFLYRQSTVSFVSFLFFCSFVLLFPFCPFSLFSLLSGGQGKQRNEEPQYDGKNRMAMREIAGQGREMARYGGKV